MKNYYQILNIPKSAKNDGIKKAYRQAALFWHPDKNKSSDAHNKFIEVNEAYNILIDSEKRKVYDHLYAIHFKTQQNIAVLKETKSQYNAYEQWVKNERVKAEKLATMSSDEILTDTFHFIDKYGALIIFLVIGISFLILSYFANKQH